jgi:hypothetical protein
VTFQKYKNCRECRKILRTKRWSKPIKFKSKNVIQIIFEENINKGLKYQILKVKLQFKVRIFKSVNEVSTNAIYGGHFKDKICL